MSATAPDGGLEVVFRVAKHTHSGGSLSALSILNEVCNDIGLARYIETPVTADPQVDGELGSTTPPDGQRTEEDTDVASPVEPKKPIDVTQTDLSSLDAGVDLPPEVSPRDIHSSDSHVRPEAGTKEQARPGSAQYEYSSRSNGSALQEVFHYTMSLACSRTWMSENPDTDPSTAFSGVQLLHGAVQKIKRANHFAYGRVRKGAWRVEDRTVHRAIPTKSGPTLPPIAPPPLYIPPADRPTKGARVSTAQRIKRRTQRLQNDIQTIERHQELRLQQNMMTYAGVNHSPPKPAKGSRSGASFRGNSTAPPGGAPPAVQMEGTATSLPAIPSADPAKKEEQFNRTMGGGLTGFRMRGPSIAQTLIDEIGGPATMKSPRTPRTPSGTPSTGPQQPFVRPVKHRQLYGAPQVKANPQRSKYATI